MYLISIYFDQESEKRISSYMETISEVTGNCSMTEGKVPPHITISSFDTKKEEVAREVFLKAKDQFKGGEVFFASVGAFLPHVLYLAPVLNQDLMDLQNLMYGSLKEEACGSKDFKISRQYRPYSWFPHATLAKKLSREEMGKAFDLMQEEFHPFQAKIRAVGLAKTNPYRDIILVSV